MQQFTNVGSEIQQSHTAIRAAGLADGQHRAELFRANRGQFLEIDHHLARFEQAGPLLQQQKWDDAKYCFLVLKPYIDSIPDNIPDTNLDGEKIDKELFMKTYKELKQFTDDIIKRLESKSWMTGKPLPPPRIVVDNCYACHTKAAKIPAPW